jgi:hypothetical protein
MNIKHAVMNHDGTLFETFITTAADSPTLFNHAAEKTANHQGNFTIVCSFTDDEAIDSAELAMDLDTNW